MSPWSLVIYFHSNHCSHAGSAVVWLAEAAVFVEYNCVSYLKNVNKESHILPTFHWLAWNMHGKLIGFTFFLVYSSIIVMDSQWEWKRRIYSLFLMWARKCKNVMTLTLSVWANREHVFKKKKKSWAKLELGDCCRNIHATSWLLLCELKCFFDLSPAIW